MDDRTGRAGDPLPAPDLDPRRRRPRRDARPRRGRGHRLHHPVGRLGRHAAARQGRQPQQRAVADRRRVPAHPRRRPDPRARDPRPHPRATSPTSGSPSSRRRSSSSTSPTGDPLGSQAPLFYGPIQQGKDGWNAAFFCGSNAVLRREALMQLGIIGYVGEIEVGVHRALRTARAVLAQARTPRPRRRRRAVGALDDVADAIAGPARELAAGRAARRRHLRVPAARRRGRARARRRRPRRAAERPRRSIAGSSASPTTPTEPGRPSTTGARASSQNATGRRWARSSRCRRWSRAVDVDRGGEAQPVMPLATISVTEDMATCMRLHGLGWRTVYHHEIARRRPRARGPRTMLHPAAAVGAGHHAGDAAREPAGRRGAHAGRSG